VFKASVRVTVAALSGLALTVGAAVSAAAVVSPVSASRSDVVHACVAKSDRHVTNYYGRKIIVIPHGTTRIVATAKGCKSWETPTSWNQDGDPGKRGADGPSGAAGTNGNDGGKGADGRNGRDGAPGQGVTMGVIPVGDPLCSPGGVSLTSAAQTVAVCDGTAGIAGLAGLTGLTGLAGATGDDGATGASGADGSDGATGAGGLNGTGVTVVALLIGDAVCATGGVYVTDASSTSYVCNGMPGATGQTGAPGATGQTGSQGATGASGTSGTAGTTGAAGSNGAAGTPGAVGATGSNGAAGTPGIAGAAGTNGAAGTAGVTGPAGATGATGTPGAKGDKGDPGTDSPNSALVGTDTGTAAAGRGYECTLGMIMLTAASVGVGTPASGQVLSIAQNTALFALLGTTYGGDGRTTFALPDLQSLAPNGMTYTICTEGIFPARY
jgi:hypothetical protein